MGDGLDTGDEVSVGVVFVETLLIHPGGNFIGFGPAVGVDFVAAEVHEGFGEEARFCLTSGQVLEETLDQVKGGVRGRIERFGAGLGRADLGVPLAPGTGVARRVHLDHHSDTALTSVLHELGDIVGSVSLLLAVGALLAEERVALGVEGKRLAVDKVPVQDVEFGVGEAVDDDLQRRDGLEVTAGVDKHAAVREAGRVGNLDGGAFDAVGLGVEVEVDELRKGL
mmetsp:Transcript_26933/g.51042  ORF Transcript_26933/g.51042 Transcript_26933/m.51042 type:complete len:225 (-) Transcript_26933:404-1078(-)